MLSHFHLNGEQRSSGVMGRHNGPSGLRDDDDDDYCHRNAVMHDDQSDMSVADHLKKSNQVFLVSRPVPAKNSVNIHPQLCK